MPRRAHSVPYAADLLQFDADPDRFVSLRLPPDRPMEAFDLDRLWAAPTVGPRLEGIVRSGEDVLVVFSDASRRAASDRLLPGLLERLGKIGAGRVRGIAATGMHRPPTEDELASLMGRAHGWIEILEHDARSPELVACEPTSRGTKVALAPGLFEADRVIVLGSCTFHYHAGFTGGPKAVFPGLGNAIGILRSHLRALTWPELERHPSAQPGILEGNPVHEDIAEAASRRPPDFLINVVTDAKGRPVAGASGDPAEAHRSICGAARAFYGVAIQEQRPLVVVSAGGHPRDRDLVQAHKALEHGVRALAPGGVLILAAALPEGAGSPGFREWVSLGSPEAIRERLREALSEGGDEVGPPAPPEDNLPGVYAQTALLLLEKTRRHRVLLVSELEDDAVEELGMEPCADLASAIERADEILGEDAPGYLIRQGAEILPLLEP